MAVILIILWITCSVFLFVTRSYHKEDWADLSKKEHPLRLLYPMSGYLVDRLHMTRMLKKQAKVEKALRLLSPLGEYEKEARLYLVKKLSMTIAVFFVGTLLVAAALTTASEELFGNQILRPEGSVSKSVNLTMKENTQGTTQEVTVEVEPVYGEAEKWSELRQETISYLMDQILLENESLTEVYTNLLLPVSYEEKAVAIEWSSDHPEVLNFAGVVTNQSIEEPVPVILTAVFSQQGTEGPESFATYQVTVTVRPYAEYEQQLWIEAANQELAKEQEEQRGEETFTLPRTLAGRAVSWKEEKEQTAPLLFLMMLVVSILCFYASDEDLLSRKKKREQQMMRDYPEILNKVTLLMGAGMTVMGAFERVVLDYEAYQKEKRYAYEEVKVMCREMKLGVAQTDALMHFGQRTGLIPYMKFCSMLIQNLQKGSAELLCLCEAQVMEAFETRKAQAKQIGEETQTRLLLPMFLMLVLVLVIILVPAFWSMQI